MADHRHHGEGEHHQGNVAMPPMPGSALVVIEPEFVFRGLKTVLDSPPMAFDRHQRFDGCSRWTPGGEEGEIAIGDTTTDQQTARPLKQGFGPILAEWLGAPSISKCRARCPGKTRYSTPRYSMPSKNRSGVFCSCPRGLLREQVRPGLRERQISAGRNV